MAGAPRRPGGGTLEGADEQAFTSCGLCADAGHSGRSQQQQQQPSSAKLQDMGCKPTGVDAKDGRPHMLGNIGQDEGLEPVDHGKSLQTPPQE